jgi:hypothetical protein
MTDRRAVAAFMPDMSFCMSSRRLAAFQASGFRNSPRFS